MSTLIVLFLAGLLTILLPCILPLIPIVLGVSIAGRSKLRPLYTIIGMIISFVGFTFLLLVVLRQFVLLADLIRLGTYYVLILFGIGFVTNTKWIQYVVAILGAYFFLEKGIPTAVVAALLGIIAMEVGGAVAVKLQGFGTSVQGKAREEFGQDSPLTALIIGLTLGLVWVPCAGPALSFALTLVRDEPGLMALMALLSYALGTAIPLLLIGYGGQAAVHSVRAISKYSGVIKRVSGVLLILTAIGLYYHAFERFQIYLLDNTSFGDLGTRIEESLFSDNLEEEEESTSSFMLPNLGAAPELQKTGEWFNSEPFTLESQQGKVVLLDFWTYSCINCIRTLPFLREYWEKYKDTGKFVLLGVHTPEFVFERLPDNVKKAIERHGLTYPIVQDNDYGTWRAFNNRYWPAKYLIDAEGNIRYTHFGEGAYEETDQAIAALLAEINVSVEGGNVADDEVFTGRLPRSHETYLGTRSWEALGNAEGAPTDAVITYSAPNEVLLDHYYLVGNWQLVDEEHQVNRGAPAEILMRFIGNEANLVLGSESGDSISIDAYIDGRQSTTIQVKDHDLYTIFDGPYGEYEIRLVIPTTGLQAFAWTFGS